MKNFLKRWDYLLITIFSSIAVIGIIFYLQDVAPFGKNSLLAIDFFHQYGPMLGELYDRVKHGMSLIYSFNMGMGLPFFRNFFNYLSSPFNLIMFIFNRSNLLMSYSFIIGAKAVASSITMLLLLNKKFGKHYSLIALSILYAFSAYFTAYYWNIMWLDGMVLLPLIVLGIEKLIDERNVLLYIISLALMLFANYFIAYMICIFSVLYFIVYLFISTKKFSFKTIGKKLFDFSISSLISGGLCAIFLIPLYFALKEISATGDTWPSSQYYAYTFKEFIFNHFSGVGSTVLKSGITCAPNISCGIICITLFIIFVIAPKINYKIKISYILLIVFLALSFIIAPIDYIWHAFHVPNDLPYRYSFIYSFVLILVSSYGIINLKSIKKMYIHILYVVMLIFITLMKVTNFVNISTDMLIMNYILISIFYLCYLIYIYFNKWRRYSFIFLIITVCLECIIGINHNWDIDQDLEGFYSDYDSTKLAINYLNMIDKSMYRIERKNLLTFNDPSWYGYNGQVTFSSMEYENMATLQHNLGMPGNEINSFYYKENTPIYNIMFNLKYIIGEPIQENYYSLVFENEDTKAYMFNNNIGLMYGVNSNVKKWHNNFSNPFKNQNDFIYKSTGIINVLNPVKYTKDIVYSDNNKTIVRYDIKNVNGLYLYFDSYDIDFALLGNSIYYLNDDYSYVDNLDLVNIYNYNAYNEQFIICNNIDDSFSFYIGYNNYYNDEFSLYELNNEKYDMVYNQLYANKVDISSFKEDTIKASYNFSEDLTIYTSIPYDIGWKVYIDGEKVPTINLANSLLAFDAPSGKHSIELKYEIPYLKLSLVLSVSSLLGLIAYCKLKKD